MERSSLVELGPLKSVVAGSIPAVPIVAFGQHKTLFIGRESPPR